MINQAREIFCQGEIPGILNICAHCEPIALCRVDFYAASLWSISEAKCEIAAPTRTPWGLEDAARFTTAYRSLRLCGFWKSQQNKLCPPQ